MRIELDVTTLVEKALEAKRGPGCSYEVLQKYIRENNNVVLSLFDIEATVEVLSHEAAMRELAEEKKGEKA